MLRRQLAEAEILERHLKAENKATQRQGGNIKREKEGYQEKTHILLQEGV